MTRGGYRPGAGRPAGTKSNKPVPRGVRVATTIPRELYAQVDAEAKKKGVTVPDILRRWIEEQFVPIPF